MNVNYLINLVLVLNIALTLSASFTSVTKSFKSALGGSKDKPKTYLQFFPKLISTFIFVSVILGIFGIGITDFTGRSFDQIRIVFLIIYVVSSWLQIWSFKEMKELNTQDILILRKHRIVQTGLFRFLRHPIYFFQILQDVSVGIALASWLVFPLTILFEIPLLILRANFEEKLLIKHLPAEYPDYKNRVRKWLPIPKNVKADR
ncbi:MAG: isoprenylcysteine carboxylmethyltransferase family protein [Ignavibacteria bacterium]|nr:isoprenylcysteine carboxylmethyltransferase family protein [Ignavibacteria bacterium]